MDLYQECDFNRAVPLPEAKRTAATKEGRSDFRRDFARLLHSPSFRRLQGKTQLYAGAESDFFRTRLTHSLEVAQIAKGMALQLSSPDGLLIDPDLVEFAGIAHDLGHPPFGHEGEYVLNSLMKRHGGFEGNAQTFRVLTRLEKKLDVLDENQLDGVPLPYADGRDASTGLNLCSRSLAAVLKYPALIPQRPDAPLDRVEKGYYASEKDVFERIREDVLGTTERDLRTVECQIMDLADDIAYSTYDLEDSFKAGFLEPLDLLLPDEGLIRNVAEKAGERLGREIPWETAGNALRDLISGLLATSPEESEPEQPIQLAIENVVATSRLVATNGHLRNSLTSDLITLFMGSATLEIDPEYPQLSKVTLSDEAMVQVEVLKRFVFHRMIKSHRLRATAHRAEHILRHIWKALAQTEGHRLMPADFAARFELAPAGPKPEESSLSFHQARVICDFIAGMTDRYAVEFFGRLTSESPPTIFKAY